MGQFNQEKQEGFIHIADVAMFLTGKIVFPMNRPALPDGTEPDDLNGSDWHSSMRAAGFLAGMEGSVLHHQLYLYIDDMKEELETILPEDVVEAVKNVPDFESADEKDLPDMAKNWIIELENTVGHWHKVPVLKSGKPRNPHEDMEILRGGSEGIIGTIADEEGNLSPLFEKQHDNIESDDLLKLAMNLPKEQQEVAQSVVSILDHSFSNNILDIAMGNAGSSFRLSAEDFYAKDNKLIISAHTSDMSAAEEQFRPVGELFKEMGYDENLSITYRTDMQDEGLYLEVDMVSLDQNTLQKKVKSLGL